MSEIPEAMADRETVFIEGKKYYVAKSQDEAADDLVLFGYYVLRETVGSQEILNLATIGGKT